MLKVPAELAQEIVILDYELPKYEQILRYINRLIGNVKVKLSEPSKEMLVKACQGLTLDKIRFVLFKAIAAKGRIDEDDIEFILEEKKQVLKRTEILEFYPAEESINDIGGLEQLKSWIKSRGLAFSQRAIDYGLPYPKGILLVGIQGSGKSLSAKVIANLWKMPLIRLDVGRLMGSLVGESESRTRQMILTAEAMAPCILWIDEIDKAFAGLNALQGDSGTSSRVFGNLLTWMQEKKSAVFIVATANDIQGLPPELLRKGRFDEIFFIDLPNAEERKEIFQVHLQKKRRYEIRNFAVDTLVEVTEGYSGAEIEQVIVDAMFQGFSEEREFHTEDIMAGVAATVPLSRTAKEMIDTLKAWAESGRARSASAPGKEKKECHLL